MSTSNTQMGATTADAWRLDRWYVQVARQRHDTTWYVDFLGPFDSERNAERAAIHERSEDGVNGVTVITKEQRQRMLHLPARLSEIGMLAQGIDPRRAK